MASSSGTPACGNCDGAGEVPTDDGPVDCPDCGGAGFLPSSSVIVEWRAREIERLYATGDRQVAQDIDWLIFELRRARSALTVLLALADEIGDDASTKQMRFAASEALGLYTTESGGVAPPAPDSKPQR